MVAWSHQSTTNGISIGSAVLAQLMVVTNRERPRPRYICSSRPHLIVKHSLTDNCRMQANSVTCGKLS